MSGRWFTGGYDETGADVKLVRLGKDPIGARQQRRAAESRQRPASASRSSAPTCRPR